MDENLHSQTKLTEFARLAPEEREQGVGHLISKIFKFGKIAIGADSNVSTSESTSDNVSQESFSSWSTVDISSGNSAKGDAGQSFQYGTEGRNLPNVLRRISNLFALKSTNLQAYADTELKQYWMPDSVSRECYECCEKFTTFRRKHHCRVCGQIFCSQCCNQKIPGKIVGCTGDLRACTYCCKVVLAYLQSPDVSAHLTADLRAFQEDLQAKFANDAQALPQNITLSSATSDISEGGPVRRKISLGYQEEKFALGRASSASYLSTEERIRALQNSISLRNLYEEICRPPNGMILQTHRYRLRSYPNTLLGSELVDWLIAQRKANTRIQASAISQALLEAGYLECVTEQNNFCDGWALYRLQLPSSGQEIPQPEQKFDSRNQDEPSWMQQIPHESSTTDSEAELPSPCTEKLANRLPSSSSSYLLDLNFEDSTVHLIRPPPSATKQEGSEEESRGSSVIPMADVPIVKTSQHRELVPETGWHNATNLRDDNGERLAYELLTSAYKHHEIGLLNQLLCVNGLSLNWRDVVIPLVHEIVDKIRPDLTHDAEYLDIRNYIHLKKIPGESRSDCKLVEGIVCTKNIAHRGMDSYLENPKILLLNCSLVYQRKEGRLMSLEPVMLQEHEYLRNVAARIVALQPSVVLVHRNVARLAQDLLRDHKITLVLNVKLAVLERLARCTGADLVTSVDAQLGRSKLGTCQRFYLKNFTHQMIGFRKTLMFFEGLPFSHLGATILLRGAPKPELTKLKQVVSTLIFASYNWRLEKSFLMDEFSQPPNPKADEFFSNGSSKESSPDFNVNLELRERTLQNFAEEPDTENKSTEDRKDVKCEGTKFKTEIEDHSEEGRKSGSGDWRFEPEERKPERAEIEDNKSAGEGRQFKRQEEERSIFVFEGSEFTIEDRNVQIEDDRCETGSKRYEKDGGTGRQEKFPAEDEKGKRFRKEEGKKFKTDKFESEDMRCDLEEDKRFKKFEPEVKKFEAEDKKFKPVDKISGTEDKKSQTKYKKSEVEEDRKFSVKGKESEEEYEKSEAKVKKYNAKDKCTLEEKKFERKDKKTDAEEKKSGVEEIKRFGVKNMEFETEAEDTTEDEKSRAECKKFDSENKKFNIGEKIAAENKKSELEDKKSEIENKKSEPEEKKSNTEHQKPSEEDRKFATERKKSKAEDTKFETEHKKSSATYKNSEVEHKNSATEDNKSVEEDKKFEAESKKSAPECKKSATEDRKSATEHKKSESEDKNKNSTEEYKKSVTEDRKSNPQGKKSAEECKKFATEYKKSDTEDKKSAEEYKKSATEHKKSAPEDSKSAEEYKKSPTEYKKSDTEDKKSAEECKKSATEHKKSAPEDRKSAEECKKSATECKKSAPEHRKSAEEYKKSPTEYKKSDPEDKKSAEECKKFATEYKKSDTEDKKSAEECKKSATEHKKSAPEDRKSAEECKKSTAEKFRTKDKNSTEEFKQPSEKFEKPPSGGEKSLRLSSNYPTAEDTTISTGEISGDKKRLPDEKTWRSCSGDDKKLPTESVSDFSDPLHLYLNVDDDVFRSSSSQQFSVAELPFANKFRKALDDTILSISPYLMFSVPYLETDLGRKCKLRPFFPEEIYYSEQFVPKPENVGVGGRNGKDGGNGMKFHKKRSFTDQLNPAHPFISVSITCKISESNEILGLLSNFRACGGCLPHRALKTEQKRKEEDLMQQLRQKTDANFLHKKIDVLHLGNHQKLAVLFCSFSHKSNNAPAFCVDPWVVNMYFYGTDDIPLGCFLDRFCFRASYACPSETCDTPMLQHVRRFVHHSGCVSLSLNSFDSQFKEEDIVMWTWCTRCSAVSPVVPMSADTWSFSLAKYLELRFHGHVYSRRGNDACAHSLHHDHYQYFGYKNIVASFKYTSVKQWEVSLPPPLIQINYDSSHQEAEIIDEIKSLALRGHEIYSVILEKLSGLPTEEEELTILKQQLQKEHNVFKGKVEEVQLKLTSPTLEDKKLNKEFSQEDARTLLWPLEDLMVQLKRIMAETVETWNGRLVGATKKDSERRREKQAYASHVTVEDTDQSETEGSTSAEPLKYSGSHSESGNVESSSGSEGFKRDPKVLGEGKRSASPVSGSVITKKIKSLDHGDSAIPENSPEKIIALIPTIKVDEVISGQHSNLDDFQNSPSKFWDLAPVDAVLNFDFRNLTVPLSPGTKSTLVFGDLENRNSQSCLNKKLRKYKSYPPDKFVANLDEASEVSDDNSTMAGHSPKGHFRSQSDGTVMAQSEDFLDSRKEPSDKKSVKTILTQLLQSVHGITHIPCPFSPQEHHLLPTTCSVPLIVYETEPASIIAYALDSNEYRRAIDELTARKLPPCSSVEQSPSPVHKRKAVSERPGSAELTMSGEKHSGLLSFLWAAQRADNRSERSERSDGRGEGGSASPVMSAGETSETEDAPSNRDEAKGRDETKKSKPPCIEVEFQDMHSNFCCRVYYAERFVWLRTHVIPAGEEAYIRSLRRSVQWNARGGKSGSSFCKTKDDRFILKEMTKQELQQFLESASNYFTYMARCLSAKLPTLLGKIVGVYQIMFRNVTTNTNLRTNLLVMENLFYNRSVTHKFDLKGSMRNRLVNPDDQDGEIVLLDENLLKRTCESPLYIYPHSKSVLTAAIQSDTKFLSSQKVMDYSLLVGLDQDTQELVVGIIDYIRTFTWDKKLEHMVKKAGMLGGQGRTPTIISPENYRDRFIAAMHRYFLQVPDRWTGLGKGLEC